MRQPSFIDKVITQFDAALSSIAANLKPGRANPAADIAEQKLTDQEKKHSAGLMRVNHTGEICAQALYQGQMLVSRSPETASMLQKACAEEVDHLAWTHQRLQELNSHRSYLSPLWYLNAYLIGLTAAVAGDQWSLGFVEETEAQVSEHLASHLGKLPENDLKSRAIVAQMKVDEEHHGQSAANAGAKKLPSFIKKCMKLHGKVMTTIAYWI